MSSLTAAEKVYLEDVLDMSSGSVLDFSNAKFKEFFKSHDVEIYCEDKYRKNGDSKAKRLRAFWEQDPDEIVALILSDLLDRYEAICVTQGQVRKVDVLQECRNTVYRLSGTTGSPGATTIDEFLKLQVDSPNLSTLPIQSAVVKVIEERLREAEIVADAGAHLSAVFLCGSTLEAVLLGVANDRPKEFNQSGACPKTDGKPKKFPLWTLSELINVACDIGILEPDVKEFSHGLRHFRNYIHPEKQLTSDFKPDKHTARLCFQVLNIALASIAGER